VPMMPVAEAAQILRVRRRQVRRLASAGLIIGRQSSAGWLLDEDSVRKLAVSQPPAKRSWVVRAARATLAALRDVGPPGNSWSGENQRSKDSSGFSG
jgi:hypothetical protein